MSKAAALDAVTRAKADSPFLCGLIEKQPELTEQLEQGAFDEALERALSIDCNEISAKLRKRRQGLALVTAIADLAGAWGLSKVTRVLSDFADDCLEEAITAAIRERYDCAPAGFAVIGLGKHGGQELNYSSDIDPIFLYDPKTLPHKDNEDVAQAAVRIGKRIIELLGARDENGYVFRVDMRLRPTPEVSPIALPVEGAISYYESSAVAWEQAAFIRARFSAGDEKLGRYFLDSIESFVWRRSLDFGQIENIRRMTSQIRSHYTGGQTFGLGYDLKRGRGGIRECEFYAQAHQLIHGGRNPDLRVADTRSALAALAETGAIDSAKTAQISSAYEALRQIEHRLQMVDDRQTHSLPESEEQLGRVARLHGLPDGNALLDELRPHIENVSKIYEELAEDEEDEENFRLADEGPPLDEQLAGLGFPDAKDAARRIARWRSGRLRAIRSDSAIAAFETTLPDIVRALGQAPDSERALARFDNVIEKLPSAINFFHLLGARPALLQLLADILSYAPVLADTLGQRVEMLDRLIEASAMDLPGNTAELASQLTEKCDGLPYELQLDRARDFVGECRFALGVQLIEGKHDPIAIAGSYAHLAEAALQALTEATITDFEEANGKVPGGELVVLALGRLGGEALTHASDLDLIFLFTGSFDAQSDGDKPMGATQYFNRLAQRATAALSVATASGALYEVDTRLRPSGAQGLLCASIDSFAKYQREEAWVWEHMALCRARPVFGSEKARAKLKKVIDQTLEGDRDAGKLKTEVIQMRSDMAAHKPPKGILDVKLLAGGLVDLEFIIHYLQLKHKTALHPQLPDVIEQLIQEDHLPAETAVAHDLLTRLLVTVRLVAPDCDERREATQALISRLLALPDWQAVMAAIEGARQLISEAWKAHLGERDF
mgnify:FL=1